MNHNKVTYYLVLITSCFFLLGCQYAQRINPVKLIYPTEGKPSVAELKNKLYSDDPEIRTLAAERLIERNDKKSFKVLRQALQDKQEEIVISVLKALTFKSDERFVEPLIEVLKTKSERLHPLIFDIFHDLGSETMVSLLLGHLEVKNQPLSVRRNLIKALGYTKQKVAVEPLLNRYPEPVGAEGPPVAQPVDPSLRPEIQSALEQLTWHSFSSKEEWVKWWETNKNYPREYWLENALFQREAMLKELVALKKELLNIRLESAKKLQAIDTEITLLALALEDDYAAIRQYALEQLANYPKDKVIPLRPKIMVKLTDLSIEVRNRAILLLGDIGDETTAERLSQLLAERESNVTTRKNIIIALSRLGGPGVAAAILNLLNQETEMDLCLTALAALVRLKPPEAVTQLINYLTPESPQREIPFLSAVLNVLGELKDPRALEPMLRFIDHANDRLRWSAANSLGKLGNPQAAGPLLKLLQDNFADIRQVTAEALGNLGDPQAVPELSKVLLNDKDTRARELAASALGKIRDPNALNSLLGALNDTDEKVRRVSWNAILIIISDNLERLEEMAGKLYETKQLTYAAEVYRKMLEHPDLKAPESIPKLTSCQGKLGIIMVKLQQYKEAIPYLETAVKNTADTTAKTELAINLVRAYKEIGDYKKTLETLEPLLGLEILSPEQENWLKQVKSDCEQALIQPK
jgi:HEAT repeat protein